MSSAYASLDAKTEETKRRLPNICARRKKEDADKKEEYSDDDDQ